MNVVFRWLIACMIVLTCGCSPYFTGVGHDLTMGAMDEVTSPSSKKHLTELAITAVRGARNEALGPTTQDELRQVVVVLGDSLREQLNTIITQELRAQVKQLVRMVVDELLGTNTLAKVGALREELVGQPLQHDLDALIAAEVPKLTLQIQQSTAPIVKEADQELAKWKPIAIAFAVGSGFLLVGLVFAFFIIHSHHKTIGTLIAKVNET